MRLLLYSFHSYKSMDVKCVQRIKDEGGRGNKSIQPLAVRLQFSKSASVLCQPLRLKHHKAVCLPLRRISSSRTSVHTHSHTHTYTDTLIHRHILEYKKLYPYLNLEQLLLISPSYKLQAQDRLQLHLNHHHLHHQ